MTRIRIGSMVAALAACGALWCIPGQARGQQSYGIDFVTAGVPDNPAFTSTIPPGNRWPINGSGSVPDEYRIGRTEITTAQWMAFVNTFNGTDAPHAPPFFHWAGPFHWGASLDPTYGGPGFRYRLDPTVPNAGMLPVYGISWRECALYCNWLEGGQSSDRASLLTGAYDVSTWGNNGDGSINDAPTHLPGAHFWIPTLSEQVKAFHYDPNRNGPGQGGYWLNKNMRDVDGISGPPGVGQTSARYVDPNVNRGEMNIPLGAYPDQLSPWGLLDTSGGTTEWNEGTAPQVGSPTERLLYGSAAGQWPPGDALHQFFSDAPGSGSIVNGFRIASSIPAPGTSVPALALVCLGLARRKRSSPCVRMRRSRHCSHW